MEEAHEIPFCEFKANFSADFPFLSNKAGAIDSIEM
jgi:hypothetical protein